MVSLAFLSGDHGAKQTLLGQLAQPSSVRELRICAGQTQETMATVKFDELVKLVHEHGRWRSDGSEPPGSVLTVAFGGSPRDKEPVFNQGLAGQTYAYEAHDVTVVLDFDDKGYLAGIEFI